MNSVDPNEKPMNPFSAPTAKVEDAEVDSGHIDLAGRGARFGAALIDAIIGAAIGFTPILMIWGWTEYITWVGSNPLLTALLGLLVGFPVFLLIHGYFLAKDGQTIGKKLVGIKIVRKDGSPADFMRIAFRRYLPVQVVSVIPMAGGVLSLVNVLFIFRASRYCLHDDIADTVVVNV